MVISVTIAEAEARMDELLDAALAGEEVVITRDDVPVAKFTPIRSREEGGWLKGEGGLDDSFFEPLPDDELRGWGLKD
jgi:prevent-host-death family protein